MASALDQATVLFVPGLRNHVEEHWQTHSAKALPGSVTVAPITVDGMSRAARVAALDSALSALEGDATLAAHSAGCLMVAHWAAVQSRPIRGALLVTPADVENALPPGYPAMQTLKENGWLPIPRAPLPFPTIVVASRNDPLARYERVADLAGKWRADLHDAGNVGHLNPAAGYGPWPDALELLEQLARETANRPQPEKIHHA